MVAAAEQEIHQCRDEVHHLVTNTRARLAAGHGEVDATIDVYVSVHAVNHNATALLAAVAVMELAKQARHSPQVC
jgi:hypothetical protein